MTERKARAAGSTNGTPPDAFTSEISQPVSVANNIAADLSKSLTRGRRKFVGDIAKAVAAEIVATEKPAVILDPDAFTAELKKHKTEERDERGRIVSERLSDEGMRLIRDRQTVIESNWRPGDISEADQYPEPLKTVVAFRLLCGQYVKLAGISMDSLRDHWKRAKLCNLFFPMADDVAAAMVATNEDPKGLFRSLSLCNETDQMRFVDTWGNEILPVLKTVEIKLKNQLGNATKDTGGESIADATPVAFPYLTIPQCADVPPNERTFAHLFSEVSCAETDDVIADEKDAKGHWRGAHELRRQSERRRGDYPKWPGVDRLRLEIESAGDVFNRAGLVKWRARQCLAVGIGTDTMNATKLVDIATRLENSHSGKTETKHPEADSVPVVDGTSDDKHTEPYKLASLKPCWRKAYSAHAYAETQMGQTLTVPQAWEYLNEYGIGEDGDELESYELPLMDTFADYVSNAWRELGEQRYTPRGGRASGSRSIRKRSEI